MPGLSRLCLLWPSRETRPHLCRAASSRQVGKPRHLFTAHLRLPRAALQLGGGERDHRHRRPSFQISAFRSLAHTFSPGDGLLFEDSLGATRCPEGPRPFLPAPSHQMSSVPYRSVPVSPPDPQPGGRRAQGRRRPHVPSLPTPELPAAQPRRTNRPRR